jgi:hypothetical protein
MDEVNGFVLDLTDGVTWLGSSWRGADVEFSEFYENCILIHYLSSVNIKS